MFRLSLLFIAATCAAACSRSDDGNVQALANAALPAASAGNTVQPAATPTPAVNGFDPSAVPIANPSLGGFPFVSLLDGYVPLNKDNSPGSFDSENQKDVGYDRYEFFDGKKLIQVEGRLRTIEAIGTGASFFQVQKNYEKVVKDLGGVTVWEGTGQTMVDANVDFADHRHRARYNMLRHEQMGVYMLRTPTREIWIEVYQAYDQKPDNYWLTVVEKKALEVTVKLMPAEEMKRALDANGHVALYFNFDTDKTTIKPDSQPLLAEVVKLLTANPTLKLRVEGHTDNAGTPDHNMTLSKGRANAVMGSLIALGVDPSRLGATGLGQTKPIADNATDDGKAKNRRVELVKQ